MKSILLTSSLLFVFLSLGLATARSQDQSTMNRQAEAHFETADAALNKVYQKLVTKLDEAGLAKLKAAQRAWVAFRDAEADFEADLVARDGSMAPMIHAGTMTALTKARTKDLEQLLKDNAN